MKGCHAKFTVLKKRRENLFSAKFVLNNRMMLLVKIPICIYCQNRTIHIKIDSFNYVVLARVCQNLQGFLFSFFFTSNTRLVQLSFKASRKHQAGCSNQTFVASTPLPSSIPVTGFEPTTFQSRAVCVTTRPQLLLKVGYRITRNMHLNSIQSRPNNENWPLVRQKNGYLLLLVVYFLF